MVCLASARQRLKTIMSVGDRVRFIRIKAPFLFLTATAQSLSWMHTAYVLCVFWVHASHFVTSRPFLMRLVWSAFE